MSSTTRFSVSLDDELLENFDGQCAKMGYSNRSEAIRDLIRASLVQERWDESETACGILTLVYDHHRHDLARRLVAIQHDFHEAVVASLHFHMDHENCVEVLMLRGQPSAIRQLAQQLVTCTGVKYGTFTPVPQGSELQ